MRRFLAGLLAALMVLSLCACGAADAPGKTGGQTAAVSWDELVFDRTMPLRYAQQFTVEYAGESYKRITINNDRVYLLVAEGAAVPDGGDYRLLTGNEMGVLLLDYLCRRRSENGTMPARPVAVTTIVSTDMADAVAAHYGVELRRTLTGFKFIGEQIGELERAGEAERYLFGFEESYGYLSGPHVRDKDAVNAALLCCEMAAWYRAQGMTLAQAMDALYERFGYYRNELQSVVLPGEDGMERMSAILTALRAAPPHTLAGERVTRVRDYLGGLDGLPASDVLELRTAHVKVIVRPSGTEPKLKLYYSAHARTMAEAAALCAAARRDMSARLGE